MWDIHFSILHYNLFLNFIWWDFFNGCKILGAKLWGAEIPCKYRGPDVLLCRTFAPHPASITCIGTIANYHELLPRKNSKCRWFKLYIVTSLDQSCQLDPSQLERVMGTMGCSRVPYQRKKCLGNTSRGVHWVDHRTHNTQYEWMHFNRRFWDAI